MLDAYPSDNEFDFTSVDELVGSLPDLNQDQDPAEFDFSSVDKLVKKNPKPTKVSAPKNPQPISSATAGGRVKSGYGLRVPPTKGASSFHQGIDIDAPAGDPLNPAEEGEIVFVGNKRGKGLSIIVQHLDGRKTEYNHLSKTFVEVGDRVKKEAIIGNVGQTGIATGPHLDFRVIDENGNYINPVNELSNDPRVDGTNLTLKPKYDINEFDFSVVDEVAKATNEDKKEASVPATDPSKIDFKVGTERVPALLHWLTSNNKPKIVGDNPLDVGDVIKAKLDWTQKYKSGRTARPDINTITDTWLSAWNPEYVELNKKFRAETGGLNIALVDSEKNLNYLGSGNYEVLARPSKGVKALFEAYKQNGLDGFNATNKLINQQISNLADNYQEAKKAFDEQIKSRPYLNAVISGIEHEAAAITHLANNMKYLTKALVVGNVKGYDSQDYLDLINAEFAEQETIAGLEESIYRPPSLAGQVIAGTVGGIVGLPRFIVAGRTIGLPTMAYLENLHRGNREAALSALPMAIMVGSMHGAQKFLGTGGGTSAPFRNIQRTPGKFTREDLSLFTEKLTSGESVSINNLSPLERQLLLRGSNAALIAGSGLATNPTQSATEFVANLIVGLTFPVGRGPREKNPILPFTTSETKREPLPPELARIPVPITEAPFFGQYKVIENQGMRPPTENRLGVTNDPFSNVIAESEVGFQARGQGVNINLPLDTAALNLVDLKRALETQSYKVEGDDFATLLFKQQAIQNAIATLEKAIPPEAIEYFEKNESTIRAALRGNQEARKLKEDFVSRRDETLTPEDVSPIRIKEPIYKNGKLREDLGQNNVLGTNRTSTENIMKNFYNVPKQGTSQSTLIPYGDVIAKKIADIGYLSAFFMEDYYHRGIEPKIDVIGNRLREALGEYGRHLTDENIKTAFKAGVDYLNSNIADPFFSRLKQDAAEKLPKRITVEQARNVLSQHKDEFVWTTGLEEFLNNAKGTVDKNELIDIIQRGQVRVEESVAQEVQEGEREWVIQNRLSQIETRLEQISIAQMRGDYESPAHVDKNNRIEVLEIKQQKAYEDGDFELYDFIEKQIQTIKEEPTSTPEYLTYFDKIVAEEAALINEQHSLRTEREKIKQARPAYSLQRYRGGERLELPGAEGSREVKLISVIPKIEPKHNFEQRQKIDVEFKKYNIDPKDQSLSYNKVFKLTNDAELAGRWYEYYMQDSYGFDKVKYQSPHWQEKDVVAHYRSSNRTTTDNQRLLFGEEFQSDWNHNIREQGINYKSNPEQAIDHAKSRGYYATQRGAVDGWWNVVLKTNTIDGVTIVSGGETESAAWNNYFQGKKGIEPNPFMQHNWKELVLKRFLRDAAIAKDENGNYKYDAIGWTTARQQMERYGGILEGKSFKWKKNSDGTYSFEFRRSQNEMGTIGDENYWETPHELNNITLERFAELTTKEAAQEVRDQEAIQLKQEPKYQARDLMGLNLGEFTNEEYRANVDKWMEEGRSGYLDSKNRILKGQFSLKEAVAIRKGGGDKYADYDVAYKNIVSKIGKRFGAKYSEKEIELGEKLVPEGDPNDPKTLHRSETIKQKIHYLEITPSMRQSLEREGLPLYGLGGSERLKATETGIRNRVTTREVFDQHRNELVKSIEDFVNQGESPDKIRLELEQKILEANKEDLESMQRMIDERKERINNVFNSGLNPDALIDQFKLLYSGVQDFNEFSSRVIKRFGEQIRPFLQDLWLQVKGLAETVGNSFDDLADYLQNGKNSPVFKARQFKEGGFLGIGTKESQAFKDYKKDKQREGVFRIIPPKWHRAISLAQNSLDFNKIYNITRSGQRAKNAFESTVVNYLAKANKLTRNTDASKVAEHLFQGNEQGKVFTNDELRTLNFNVDEIEAYNTIRKAVDLNLEWRKQHFLYNMRERADQLNDRFLAAEPDSPEYERIATQLLNLTAAMDRVEAHYEHLKNSGYISLQRQGEIVALANDANGLVYQHFKNVKDANAWILEQEANGATGAKIYDFRRPEDLRSASAKLTPGQFEDLLDQAGVNPNTPEIEALRDEVYSRYPSYSYQLKRDFTPGYDRNWQFALKSIVRQTEIYGSSFYSRVAGNEAMKKLSSLGLYDKNPEMYEITKKFIDDEISSGNRDSTAVLRKAVYLINLGGDINQLYLNAIAQPITQTYSYFARVEHNGIRLGRAGAEKYFIKAGQLVNKLAANRLAEQLGSDKRLDVDPLFEQIYSRLQLEKVIEPEFNKSLLESEAEKSVGGQLAKKIGGINRQKAEHWASVFMRAGEKTTRAHVAAEAFLVGTEKFNLAGEELVDFMVRAVDATQSNPSRGEAPYYVRKFGGAGKLLYQFNAFNHMWLENLALNARSDFANRRISATARHLAPLVVMGGIRGLPLTGFAFALYTLMTGDDLKKKYFDKWFKNNETLERMALYGVTTSPAISQKITPSVPILDTIRVEDTITDTLMTNFESSTIPALSTSIQISRGIDDILSEGQFLRGLAGISPRAIRGPLVATRTVKEGYRTRGGEVIVNKKDVSTLDKIQQSFNITPIKVSEYYEKKKTEQLKQIDKRIKRRLRKLL